MAGAGRLSPSLFGAKGRPKLQFTFGVAWGLIQMSQVLN